MTRSTASPIWHPFTQHALHDAMTMISRAHGAYLFTPDGRRIIDAISSWWVVTHGHCSPDIVRAIQTQAESLNQIIFAGQTHEAAEEVAARLLKLVPPNLKHVFFSDSGSTSVEVALKMALGYWRNIGAPRSRIVVMENSYHGDTVGTMSVGERGVFNASYEPLLFDVIRVPFPHPGQEQQTYAALEAACRNDGSAAFIVEPLVLGAGGMLMYPPSVLKEMKRICDTYDVFFIADEVMTGWGRTGTLFACEQADVAPDIVCYSKGLTGGALPLAVTLCSAEIFDAHYSKDRSKTFFHSSSYTGNAVACAAALANLKMWDEENTQWRLADVVAMQTKAIEKFRSDGRFTNVRQTGTITALDLKAKDAGYLAAIGPKLQAFFASRNILLRPLGNTIYVMPPYCVTQDDLDEIYGAIDDVASGAELVTPPATRDSFINPESWCRSKQAPISGFQTAAHQV